MKGLTFDPVIRFVKLAKRCFRALFFPLFLALVFVVQNVAFNEWLRLDTRYRWRLCASSFALGMLLYAPVVFLPPRWRHAALVVISSAVSALLLAEYLYYSYSGGFLQISALKLIGESSAVMGTAVRLVTPGLALFLVNVFLTLFILLRVRFRGALSVALTRGEKTLAIVLILIAVFGGYHILFAAEKRDWGNSSRLYSQLYDLNGVVGKMGVVNYFLEDAVKRALASGKVTEADRKFVQAWKASRPAVSAPGKYFGAAKGRNLIFIQVESLENAVIGAKLGGVEITPNLNALAHEGLYFSDYVASVGLGNTADAEFATLNSLYPLPDSVAFVDYAQNTYAALPQLLADHGYGTYVFHGDVATFWNRANIYPSLGYKNWYMKDAFKSTRNIGITGLGDEDFFKQSLPKLMSLPRPFMATLMTLSSHTPFLLPEDLRTLVIPDDSGLSGTQAQYLESVHYTDKVLGDFILSLKATGLWGDSLIVIFGDHGSYTGISQALGNSRDGVAALKSSQVPLIILAPGTGLRGEMTLPASHLDIYPTVANLLGVNAPRSILGQDLLNAKDPVAVYRKNGVGGISAIEGKDFIYLASRDGDFNNGSCLAAQTRQLVPIDACRSLYDSQSAILRISDTVVRGDLIRSLF